MGVHHAAGGKEQQGLEESVREHMEHRRIGAAQPKATNMNANWPDGRIGQDAFHIVLSHGRLWRPQTAPISPNTMTTSSASGEPAKIGPQRAIM